ncbi:MAG: hypothetical protein CM15mP125_2940 [Gammaproteobacteria bacterium]|nr:MAG: hypothetical protein CM15mP125_2940 [Gammaproteobacteria bacterium]
MSPHSELIYELEDRPPPLESFLQVYNTCLHLSSG